MKTIMGITEDTPSCSPRKMRVIGDDYITLFRQIAFTALSRREAMSFSTSFSTFTRSSALGRPLMSPILPSVLKS